MAKKNSDVKAKTSYIEVLKQKGFTNPTITASPADIVAEKNGEMWFFEIKMTKTASRGKAYFGAATITEWQQALETPDHYKFVIAYTDAEEESFEFVEYTPAQFMAFSTIPPFKIFFNIPAPGQKAQKSPHRKTALYANESTLKKLNRIYKDLKSTQKKDEI